MMMALFSLEVCVLLHLDLNSIILLFFPLCILVTNYEIITVDNLCKLCYHML